MNSLVDDPATGLYYRVLVKGSRQWTDGRAIMDELGALLLRHPEGLLLMHGADPRGADRFTELWYRRNAAHPRLTRVAFPVPREDWARLGKSADPQRNQRMIDAGPDLVLAFPRGISASTRGCMRMAQAAGIPLRVRQAGAG